MLSAFFCAHDLGAEWSSAADGWRAGRSWIRPYAHAALQAALLVSPRRVALVVRERTGSVPLQQGFTATPCSEEELDAALARARSWPLEFLEVLIARENDEPQVTLRCGRWGTAPVYLLSDYETLRVDWNAPRLYPQLKSAALDPGIAAEGVMRLEPPYSRRTIFPEMSRLTERAVATWRPSRGRASIDYPAPEPRASPGRVVPGADVTGAFCEILLASMRRWTSAMEGPAGVELSGGLDSSIVAAGAARVTSIPVRSFGLIMPGPCAAFQQARRNAMIQAFGLIDRTLACIEHPPFSPASLRVRNHCYVPWDEFYAEAVGAMLGFAATDGVTTIFTGMGGDELGTQVSDDLSPEERNERASRAKAVAFPPFATDLLREAYLDRDARVDRAPQTLLHTSAVESAAAVSTLYLGAGVWPASPLCTPELVEFCRRLPSEWRRERTLHRKVLTALGCPPLVAYPKAETLEHFGDVMEFALREAAAETITEIFRAPRLAEQGLVDGPQLAACYEQLRGGDLSHMDYILGTLSLELTIRSVEHQRAARQSS